VKKRASLARRTALFTGAAALAMALIPSAAVVASPFVTFDVTIGETCITGTARPVGSVVAIRVNTPGGQAKGYGRSRVGTDHRYGACVGGAQSIVGVLPGDEIVARIGDIQRHWTVPTVNPVVNRDTDAVSGITVPNSSVHVLLQAGWTDRRPRFLGEMTVSSDGSGKYLAAFAGTIDIWASDDATVTVAVGRDRVSQVGTAISLQLTRGSNNVGGYATTFRPFEIQLVAPGPGAVRATAIAYSLPPIPSFGIAFVDASGNPVYPRPGDRVVVPGEAGASARFPRSSLSADTAADTVAAQCMPSAPYVLRIDLRGAKGGSVQLKGTTGSDGRFERHVDGDVQRGDYLVLECSYPTRDMFRIIDQVN
jgi:hypothetical protein